MNLDELQAMLDTGDCMVQRQPAQVAGATATVAAAIADVSRAQAPVRLVPRPPQTASTESQPTSQPATLQERLHEIEMAQKLGYLLCRCSWPPQIMVLTGSDHVYRCRRCSRVREM
ncbi:MAG: hypothetical protein Q7V56_03410 [Gammaproteobacteria bacterium]|nr:hypothetical protein [Gammaproteobacteria bacterium]